MPPICKQHTFSILTLKRKDKYAECKKMVQKTKIAPRGSITETHYHPAIIVCIHRRYECNSWLGKRREAFWATHITVGFNKVFVHRGALVFYYLHIVSVLPRGKTMRDTASPFEIKHQYQWRTALVASLIVSWRHKHCVSLICGEI